MATQKLKEVYWICDDCGQRYGRWYQKGYTGPLQHYATYHMGKCDVCNAKTSVTEPRDYGHLIKNWKYSYQEDKANRELKEQLKTNPLKSNQETLT